MEKYYNEFEDTEENKLVYMDIFKEYVSTLTFFCDIKWLVKWALADCELLALKNNALFKVWNHIFSAFS